MALRRILVPVSGERSPDPLVESAFALAERHAATVQGVHVRRPYALVPDLGALPVPGAMDLLMAESEKQMAQVAKRARDAFETAAAQRPGVAAEIVMDEGLVPDVLAAKGALADLCVAGDAGTHDSDFWRLARDTLLFGTGRPVLVLPDGALVETTGETTGETVVVAWKRSLESARALAAALPFIAEAKAVHAVSVREDDTSEAALQDVVDYLKLHNAAVTGDLVDGGRKPTGAVLLDAAAQRPGALLVMGAYGHWRLRERVFGGVTERVLRGATMPVLMAH